MKKLFAVLLAVAMLLSLGVTAFAAGNGEIIILDPPENSTYTAYKIFDAVTGADGKVSYTTDTTWIGKIFTVNDTTKKVTMVENDALEGLKIVPLDDSLTSFQVVKSTGFDAKKFAEYISTKLDGVTGVGSAVDQDDGEVKMTGLDPGYYLVKGGDGSLALTNVLENQTVKVQNKKDMPLDKDVEDEDGNDINNQGVSVGDELSYTITTKVPELDAGVTDYTFLLSDTMSEGLTFGNKLTITIGNDVYTIEYFPATDNTVAGQEKIKVTGGSDITVNGVAVNPNDPASIAAAVASVNDDIATSDADIATLQADVNAAQAEVDNAAQDLVAAKAARDAKQAELDALIELQRLNEYPVTVGETNYDAAGLAAAITAAEGELRTLETAVGTAQTTLNGKIDALNAAVGELEAEKTNKAKLEATLRKLQNIGEEGFTLVTSETDLLIGDQVRFYKNGKTFELSLDMLARQADHAGDLVTIEYTAVVNENAVAEILQNAAVLAFGEGSEIDYRDAETDNYTSQIIIDKFETGNRSQKLAGAEFVLKDSENKYYRLTGKPVILDPNSADGMQHKTLFPDELEYAEVAEYIPYAVFVVDDDGITHVSYVEEDANGNLIPKAEGAYYIDVKVEWAGYESMATKIRTDAEGRGVFAYLPDGDYKLIETKAPIDYIKLEDPITINVDGHAATDKSLDKTQRIAALTNGVNVENTPGSSLPSTGGVGATLLTIGGVVLMLAAGAFLVLRRRKEQE